MFSLRGLFTLMRSVSILAVIALCLCTATPAGPANSEEESGQRVAVGLVKWGTQPGGPTTSVAKADRSLVGGETGSVIIASGWFGDDGTAHRATCNGIVASSLSREDESLEKYPDLWSATFHVLPSEIGRIRLDLDWKHMFSAVRGQPEQIGGDHRTITLREGEHHVLDYFAPVQHTGQVCYVNTFIGIEAEILEDSMFAGERLVYDLWLVHENAGSEKSVRRIHAEGRQGESVPFDLPPVRIGLENARLSDGAEVEAILKVSGTIRGRLRRDGSIDLELDAGRRLGAEETGTAMRGSVGDRGRKVFTIIPDETVSLVLPSPFGGRMVGSDASNATFSGGKSAGVATSWGSIVDGQVRIDFPRLYERRQDSLILEVSRQAD